MNSHVGIVIIFGSFFSHTDSLMKVYYTNSYMQKYIAKGLLDFF
jgi:hypothetical protein